MKRIAITILFACACSTARMAPPPVIIIYQPQPVAPLGGAGLATPIEPSVDPLGSVTIEDGKWISRLTDMPEHCKPQNNPPAPYEMHNGKRVTWCDCSFWVDGADVCWP